MKTILGISLMTILISGLIAPTLQEAHAYPVKADNSEKLKPKSFGVKIKDKIPVTDSQNIKHNIFDGIKQEEVKAYKKIYAEAYAKQVLKKLYKLG
ncbi:MAG: hypothetical protein KGZ37_04820 [Nitrosarchaeum sp.]|nr:hypothetical protein [Nitrosarchaeum sp.]